MTSIAFQTDRPIQTDAAQKLVPLDELLAPVPTAQVLFESLRTDPLANITNITLRSITRGLFAADRWAQELKKKAPFESHMPTPLELFSKHLASAESLVSHESLKTYGEGELPENLKVSFYGVNARGIKGYNDHLFGPHGAELSGVKVLATHLPLYKIIMALPDNADVVDLGGGMGIFAIMIQKIRPDLNVTVVDLSQGHTRDIQVNEEALTAEWNSLPVTSSRHYNTRYKFEQKDALTFLKQTDRQFDLVISASLMPYVDDPLALLCEMYNKTKDGGLTLTTLSTAVFEAHDHGGDKKEAIIKSALGEIKSSGIEMLTPNHHKTFFARKKPGSRLQTFATRHKAEIRFTQISRYTAVKDQHVFYSPARTQGPRWIGVNHS